MSTREGRFGKGGGAAQWENKGCCIHNTRIRLIPGVLSTRGWVGDFLLINCDLCLIKMDNFGGNLNKGGLYLS